MSELRLARRSLLRQPTFTLAVTLTLGLAMGVATGFFGVIDAILLRPLPGVNGKGLVNIYATVDGELAGFSGFSLPTLRDLREHAPSFSRVEGFAGRGFALGDEAVTDVVGGQLVTGRFFELLGTRAHRGRLVSPEDDHPGAAPSAVITHALWQKRFGGRSDMLGRTVRVNGRPVTVVGIAEPGFRGHFVGFPIDLFLPLASAPLLATDVALEDRADESLELVARLASGADRRSASTELSVFADRLAHDFPSTHRGRGVTVRPYTGLDADLRGAVVGFTGVLGVVGALVLLVACVNVGGLVLARGATRERDLAVRAALGASRADLVRPLLAETVVLFAFGGILGGGARFAFSGRSPRVPPRSSPSPSSSISARTLRVGLFAVAATFLVGVTFGLLPAVTASRVDVMDLLKRGGRHASVVSQTARRAFVAAQVALCLVLLVGAGLFLRELEAARRLDPGFRIQDVGLVRVDASLLDRSPAASRALFETWLARMRAHPGVVTASLARTVPLGFGQPATHLLVDGLEPPVPEGFRAGWNAVAPAYFETLGIPLLAGRDFGGSDSGDAEPVAIVSRATAARLFPGTDPLGRFVRRDGRPLRVVGVVGDVVVHRSARRDGLFIYVPYAQTEERALSLVVRGRGPLPLEEARRQVRALDADLPVLSARSLEEHAGATLFPQRMAAAATTAFAAFALLLASVGLYGVVAFLVEKRRHELAVRAALGAGAGSLRRLVLRQGLRPVFTGLVLGLAGALALGRGVAAFVPSVGSFDPVVFATGAIVLLVVSLVAADVPARRAAGVRPMDILRGD